MKRIIFLVILFFAMQGGTQAFEFDKTPNRYDRGDISQHNASLNFLRLGLLEKAVEAAFSIKDYELKWMMLYAISTDGYASRGKIEEAVALTEEVVAVLRKVTNIESLNRKDVESYFETTRQNFFDDIIVAAVEGGHWEKSLPVFSKLSRTYYRLQAIEKTIARLPNKKAVEDFLEKMNYDHILGKDNAFLYLKDVFKNPYYLVVLWDDNEDVRIAYHKLTQEQLRELKESRW